MLRFIIIVAVALVLFMFVYNILKKAIYFWNVELADESLKDQKDKINIEKEKFDENLKNAEKELKKKQEEIETLKKD